MKFFAFAFLFPVFVMASPTPVSGGNVDRRYRIDSGSKPPAFFLAGDSTTAVQSTGGGGWGNGFLSFLEPPAFGVNKGHNGATTVSYVAGGDWAQVLGLVKNSTADFDVYVTIQFGHNDQKPENNISVAEFQSNLENLVKDVTGLGASPLVLTSLTRRNFNGTQLVDDLTDVVQAARAAASNAEATLLDLNAASRKYVQAIGQEAADKYNLNAGDRTHLNAWGSVVFGRIVADLLLEQKKDLCEWIAANQTLSDEIAQGIPA